MPYIVDLPDGRSVEFPDDIPPEQAEQILRKQFFGAAAGAAPMVPREQQLSRPPIQNLTTPATTISGEVLEVLKGLPRGAIGLLESAAAGATAILPDETERAARASVAEFFRPAREELAPEAGYEESIGARAGEALGSTIPFLAAGPLGLAGRVAATGLGVAAGAGEARLRAEQEGGMEERGTATALGALVGATEVLPIFRILNRLPEKEALTAIDYVKRAAAAGGEEFAQEASANVAQNLIEKGLYNPEQDVFEGAAEEGAYGFGVGAFIQGLTDLAMGRRVRGAVAPPEGEDERTRLGAEQVVEGADTGGVGLPVSRVGAERPDVEGLGAAGVGLPRVPTRRLDEGEEGVQPPLEPARFQIDEDPDAWYYSELARQTERLPLKAATPQQWLATLRNKNVKDEELEYTGFKDWLEAQEGNVSKEDALNYLANNGVRLEETMLGEGAGGKEYEVYSSYGDLVGAFGSEYQAENFIEASAQAAIEDLDPADMPEEYGDDFDEYRSQVYDAERQNYSIKEKDIPGAEGIAGPAKYTGYKHPFGDNYRELIIRVPKLPAIEQKIGPARSELENVQDEINDVSNRIRSLDVASPAYAELAGLDARLKALKDRKKSLQEELKTLVSKTTFQESHWDDYGKNAIGHMRMSDMNDGKVLMVHEMQSQLAQTGRDFGFIGEEKEPKTAAALQQYQEQEKIIDDIDKKLMDISEQRQQLEYSQYDLQDAINNYGEEPRVYPLSAVPVNSLATGAEIISDFEKGESPYALFKTQGGDYLGIFDRSKGAFLTKDGLKERLEILPLRMKAEFNNAVMNFESSTAPTEEEARRIRRELIPIRGDAVEKAYQIKEDNLETSRGSLKTFNTPRFPFSGSTDKWQNLILKRILKYAADNGYERIMFPQGQEARRYTMGDLRGQEFFYDVISPKNIKSVVNKYKGKVTFSKVRSPWELEPKISAAIKKELEANPSVASAYEALGEGESTGKKRRTAFARLMRSLRDNNIDMFTISGGGIGVGKLDTPQGIETNNAIREFIDAVNTYRRESRPLDETRPGEVRTVIEITPEMRSNLLVKLPLFRMGRRTTKGMAVSQVQKIVSELSQGWANKPNIKIVNTYKDLPPAYRSDKYAGVRGMLLGNDVYIVAANAGSPSEVKATLFHESLGHYGLRQLFRNRLDKALGDIYKTNTAVQAQADAWLRGHPNTYHGPDRTIRAVEEVLAAKSEAGVIKEPGIRAAFNRLAAMIRKFIRGMGIQLDYTNNDINNILLEAAERVRTGPTTMIPLGASPRFQERATSTILTNMAVKNNQLPEWSQSLGDGVVETLSNLPENLRRGQYYVYSLPHMVELLERYIPRIKAIDRFISYRASYTTGLMKTAADNHAKYSRVVQQTPGEYESFKNVVNDINLFQVPVREQSIKDLLTQDRATLSPQKQKYYDIAKKFYELPEAFQNSILSADGNSGLFADYRKMGDKKFDIFAEVYGGQLGMGVVRDLRERFERERLPMYAPLVRGEGAHWLYYETPDGRAVKEPFSNAAQREAEIKRITQEGLANVNTIQRVTRPSEVRQKGPPPVGFLGEVVTKLEEKLSGMPEAERKIVIDGVYDTFLQYLPSNMLRQELTSRQTAEVDGAMQFGVLGFDPDVLAVYDRTMPKMAYQLGNLKYALPIENAMKKITEQAKLYEIAIRDNNIPERLRGRKLMTPKAVFDGVEDIRRRLNFAYNPSYAPWVNAAATANYVYSIAGNISSALINTTVLAMLTFPSLIAQYGPVKSIAAMGRAMKMFLEGGVDDQGNFTFGNAATGEMKTFFDYLEKRGAIGVAAEQELRQAQRARVSGYESTMDKINFVAGYVFKNSERFNREVTMLASFMLAREKGKGFRTAAEEAIRLNNNINGTVLPEQASRMYQTDLGRVILTFRTFALTQIIALSRAFGRALNIVDATPEERSYARKQLLGIYGATYMVAGIKGLPLFGAAEVLASALMGDDDEPYDLQQEVIESVGLLGLNGPLNAALQVDIASRTGFNGMLWRDDPKRLAEIGYPLYLAERIAGPTYGLVQAQIRGIENLMNGEVQRGFESILPAPLRNPLKAARYATDGALTKDGLPIVDDVNAWNSTMQVFGFAPAELAATQEQIGATFEISDKLRNRRTALLTNVYTATEAGDAQAMIEAYEAINKFNAANPFYMIDPKSLRASFRERRRRALEAVNGIYLPRNLRMATDALMAEPY
jgi:hypothetical protein